MPPREEFLELRESYSKLKDLAFFRGGGSKRGSKWEKVEVEVEVLQGKTMDKMEKGM